ncbi:Vacuolar import/degradation protein Vid24 [Macrophomina phaseolina MS6]|uniref:Vacuolar import/degradation protein Vid24 n=2 Tax=Macrophomina phaseolina TaxID=35725 RepID=K2RX35_MACPH|nr:Vacuolar import/degradation protein Vid24 [Macrophomina phaseolina MS6]
MPSHSPDQLSGRTTCPPDISRPPAIDASASTAPDSRAAQSEQSSRIANPPDDQDSRPNVDPRKQMDTEDEGPLRDTPSPLSATGDAAECDRSTLQSPALPSTASPSWYPHLYGSAWPEHRFLPNSTSSFLRPGSKFKGTQQSDRQVYEVQVEIKHVDMESHCLSGYLRIQGLTDDHPTLTTYFEGEIIGTKYTFQTNRPEWGSNEKVDMQHWGRFPAWRPLAKQAKRADFTYKNFAQRENLFMRWKEHFLVPDHTVRTISGASFEGFYYICFSQVTGKISGIYFHAKSEKYQQLDLEHVEDHGCMGAIEFR